MAFPSAAALTSGASSPLTLQSKTVDLWSCALDASGSALDRCRQWLSAEERVRAGRFLRSEDQTAFAAAHGVLRFVLARYVNLHPADVRFRQGATGKPALLNPEARDHVRFNLSHSHGRMLIAVSTREVGADLEEVRANVDPLKLAERFYSLAEYERIANRAPTEQALEFYRLWVAKEAVLKGQAIGIPSLSDCEIVLRPASCHASVRTKPDSPIQCGWTIQWLNCGIGWEGAVSAFGNDWVVRILDA